MLGVITYTLFKGILDPKQERKIKIFKLKDNIFSKNPKLKIKQINPIIITGPITKLAKILKIKLKIGIMLK